MFIFSDLRLLNVISFIFFVFLFSLINAFILLLFCYYFVTRIHWSNKTNRYICIGNKIRT